jgi:hypothetical protein
MVGGVRLPLTMDEAVPHEDGTAPPGAHGSPTIHGSTGSTLGVADPGGTPLGGVDAERTVDHPTELAAGTVVAWRSRRTSGLGQVIDTEASHVTLRPFLPVRSHTVRVRLADGEPLVAEHHLERLLRAGRTVLGGPVHRDAAVHDRPSRPAEGAHEDSGRPVPGTSGRPLQGAQVAEPNTPSGRYRSGLHGATTATGTHGDQR